MSDQTNNSPLRPVRELPLSERPRERLDAHGPHGLSAGELLAVLWGTGRAGASSLELANDLLSRHGGLYDLAHADPLELSAVAGIGRARAAQLVAAFEIGRRSLAERSAERWTIRAPRDVAERLLPRMGGLPREELRVLLLNAKNAVLREQLVYQGNVSTALVRVAELFRDAVRIHAAGVIVVHNHPSGDPEPSPDDLHLTAEAIAAGRLLDIPLLDHVVVAAAGFVSLRDRGVAFDRPAGWR
ncbi:MAG TPA: DNA repair protein RadC [Candidatus Limnocylindrales bacterium]|nr:DNA repair protein RadC [Candidatus Limnocylindrales bacterium]